MTPRRKIVASLVVVLLVSLLSGCSSLFKKMQPRSPQQPAALGSNDQPIPPPSNTTKDSPMNNEGEDSEEEDPDSAAAPKKEAKADPKPDENKKVSMDAADLNTRVASLEARLAGLSDKINSTRSELDQWLNLQKNKPTRVVTHPADAGGSQVHSAPALRDPSAGFTEDAAVQSYRKGILLLKSERYSDSVLAFSNFLEKFPDHPLAGMAQYYIGESYMRQKEYKLALEEFQRVLTSYDRSAYIAKALNKMAEAEDELKKTQDANKHRQLLSTLFPHSPAALAKVVEKHEEKTEKKVNPNSPTTSSITAPSNTQPETPAPQKSTVAPKLDEPPTIAPPQSQSSSNSSDSPDSHGSSELPTNEVAP